MNAISAYIAIARRYEPALMEGVLAWLPAKGGDLEEAIEIVKELCLYAADHAGARFNIFVLIDAQLCMADEIALVSMCRSFAVVKAELVEALTHARAPADVMARVEALWAPLMG